MSNVTVADGAMLAAPSLQLILFQIFSHLQVLKSDSDAIRVHYNSIKEDFSREEDRCRKEQERRYLLEQQLSEETTALRLRAQEALETASESEQLLHLASKVISDLKSEHIRLKEMNQHANELLASANGEIRKHEVALEVKERALQDIAEQHNLTLKELEDVVEERDRIQSLLELKEEQLQKVKENASLTEGHLQVTSLQLDYFRNASEVSSSKLDEARHKATVAEGQLHVAVLQIAHYRELAEEKHALLEHTKHRNVELNHELKAATGELEHCRNLAEENNKLLEQSDRECNNTKELLEKIRVELKELEKVAAERRTMLEISDEKTENTKKELENAKQHLSYFKGLAQNRETVIQQVQEKANITEGYLNVARQQTERFKNLAVNATRDLLTCKAQLEDIMSQVRWYLLPLVPSIAEGLTTDQALLSAARAGNVTEMFILLMSGADIESYDPSYRETPLTWAAEKGHLETCRFLIERHADVNARSIRWKNRTPLHAAAIRNHLAVAQLLVDSGAEIGAVNSDGLTPADEAGHLVREWLVARAH